MSGNLLLYPAPVEPLLWAALLVGHADIDIACHFASAPSWGCNVVTEWHDRCPDLADSSSDADTVRHDAEAGSASVACSGPADGIADLMTYGGGYVPTCAAHAAWLRHHCWLDGMNAGFVLWRSNGTWEAPKWPGLDGEIAQWRALLPRLGAINAASRSSIAAASAALPDGVEHSRHWRYQVAQEAERARR